MKIVIFIMLATVCMQLDAIKRQKNPRAASVLVQAAKKRALLNDLHQQQQPDSARIYTELAALITVPGALKSIVDPETAHIGIDTQNQS